MLPLFLILYGEDDDTDRYSGGYSTMSSSTRYDSGYTVDLLSPSYGADGAGYGTGAGYDTDVPAAYQLDAGSDRYETQSGYDSGSYDGLALGVPAYDEFYDALT